MTNGTTTDVTRPSRTPTDTGPSGGSAATSARSSAAPWRPGDAAPRRAARVPTANPLMARVPGGHAAAGSA
ncbi:hypothetical protein ABT050_07550, partial [Streptomyces mirabilis]